MTQPYYLPKKRVSLLAFFILLSCVDVNGQISKLVAILERHGISGWGHRTRHRTGESSSTENQTWRSWILIFSHTTDLHLANFLIFLAILLHLPPPPLANWHSCLFLFYLAWTFVLFLFFFMRQHSMCE